MSVVLVSGGYDPLTRGHVRYIEAAQVYGRVVVALNSDDWLRRKKGYVFQDWEHRAEILRALRAVSLVIAVDDSEGHVAAAIRQVQPRFFANGGDRTTANEYEDAACRAVRAVQLFGVGGPKIASSSALVEAVSR